MGRILKRVTALALVTLMVLGCVGCAKKEEPSEVLANAVEKTSQLTSASMYTEIAANTIDGDDTEQVSLSMDLMYSGIGTDDYELDLLLSMGIFGMSMDIRMIYFDNTLLTEFFGEKTKDTVEGDEVSSLDNLASVQMIRFLDLGLVFSNIEMNEVNKEKKITFEVDAEQTLESELFKSKVSDFESIVDADESLGLGDLVSVLYNLDSYTGSVTVDKNGYITDMEIHIVDSTDDVEMTVTTQYRDPGSEVKIEIPDNLDEYVENEGDYE